MSGLVDSVLVENQLGELALLVLNKGELGIDCLVEEFGFACWLDSEEILASELGQ